MFSEDFRNCPGNILDMSQELSRNLRKFLGLSPESWRMLYFFRKASHCIIFVGVQSLELFLCVACLHKSIGPCKMTLNSRNLGLAKDSFKDSFGQGPYVKDSFTASFGQGP